MQDALRRLISSSELAESDIDELVQLVKKECGDSTVTLNAIPLDNTHIPVTAVPNRDYARLINLSNPINICALHQQGSLQFSATGLTVVYGGNGSGKSSYSRILKKLCWRRNPSIALMKNVFHPSESPQQVDFDIQVNDENISFTWDENSSKDPILNTIFVFDNDCANIYINNENPAEYKPIGIDILEKLVLTYAKISQKFDLLIESHSTPKPPLPDELSQTDLAQWYETIEGVQHMDIDSQLQFTQTDLARKQELANLTTRDPQENISNLSDQKNRINSCIQQIRQVEAYFDEQSINEIIEIRSNFEEVNKAHQIVSAKLRDANMLEGFGTSPWRALWEAAKKYAHSSNLSDGKNFPSLISLERCVLCQQELDKTAQQRLKIFDQFVLNDVSKQLNIIKR